MKAVAVQKAINVIKSKSWTSPLDFRYQDETSQYKVETDQAFAARRDMEYVPRPWESLHYLAKEDLGRIHVRGFLHDQVAQNPDGSFSHPSSLSTEEMIGRLDGVWRKHAETCRPTEVNHHRLVFSLSGEFHDTLVRAGRNPDMVLRSAIEKSMRSLQEKFHPGDSIGYTYGLHHDTDNLHAHVFIHPRTRAGAFVGMSQQLKKKAAAGAESRHKDQLGFVRDAVRRRVIGVLKELQVPQEASYLAKHLQSEKMTFVPKISHTSRARNDFSSRLPTDFLLEQKRAAISTLDEKIRSTKSRARTASQARNIARIFLPRMPKWYRTLEKGNSALLWREVRDLQQRRRGLMADYRSLKRNRAAYTETAAHRSLTPALRQRHVIAPTRTIRFGGPKREAKVAPPSISNQQSPNL